MQSSQSRLKSRRMLGVGEGADGQQHRSKITQILGNDSLANWQISRTEYPFGLQALQCITCLWFAVVGLASLFLPGIFLPANASHAMDSLTKEYSESGERNEVLLTQVNAIQRSLLAVIRIYGAAMIGLATLCIVVNFANGRSRRAIRIALLVEAVFSASELLASVLSVTCFYTDGIGENSGRASMICTSIRAAICIASVYYFVRTAPQKQHPINKME